MTSLLAWAQGRRPQPHSPAPLRSTLRPYQVDAVDAVLHALSKQRSTALDIATGLGKTTIACAIANEWPHGRVLFCAHRRELISQLSGRLEQMNQDLVMGDHIGIELAGESSCSRNHFVVASNQSIWREKRLARLQSEGGFGLIIIDEGHRAGENSKTYTNILAAFPDAKVLGLSATFDRLDGDRLPYESAAYSMDIRTGIRNGWLVPLRARTVHLRDVDLDLVESSHGDLSLESLDREMAKGVVGVAKRLAEMPVHRQGIVFLPGVQSAQLCASLLCEYTGRPEAAICITGATPEDERDKLMREFRRGGHQWLVNVNVATEGFDAPAVDVVAMAAPTTSRARYTQRVGRGTRPICDLARHKSAQARLKAIAASRKPHCLILNFTANCTKHSLIGPADLFADAYDHRDLTVANTSAESTEAANDAEIDVLDALECAERDRKAAEDREIKRATRKQQREAIAKATLEAKVKSIEEDYDPFQLAKLLAKGRVTPKRGKIYDDAADILSLRAQGIPEDAIQKRGVEAWMKWTSHQRRHGLISYKQWRQLSRFGIRDTSLSFATARAAMAYLRECSFVPSMVDPWQLQAICYPPKAK